jgi:hypothetical protein
MFFSPDTAFDVGFVYVDLLNIIYLSSQGCDLSEAKTALALDLVGVLVIFLLPVAVSRSWPCVPTARAWPVMTDHSDTDGKAVTTRISPWIPALAM